MIHATASYEIFLSQLKEIYKFSDLVLHSGPLLEENLNRMGTDREQAIPLKPVFLKDTCTESHLRKCLSSYQFSLSKYIFLSTFTFFESYVSSVITELFEFHGGTEELKRLSSLRSVPVEYDTDVNIDKCRKKLQEYPDKKESFKYMKYTKELERSSFKFPSEILAEYGIDILKSRIDKKSYKAVQIIPIMKNAFHFNADTVKVRHAGKKVTSSVSDTFEKFRSFRNDLVHGEHIKNGITHSSHRRSKAPENYISFDLKNSYGYSSTIKKIASEFDRHLLNHFFITEKYR